MAKGAGKARKKLPKALPPSMPTVHRLRSVHRSLPRRLHLQSARLGIDDAAKLRRYRSRPLHCRIAIYCERCWCPWDAIEMIKPTKIADAVAVKGGPADYIAANQEKLNAAALTIQNLALELAAMRGITPREEVIGIFCLAFARRPCER